MFPKLSCDFRLSRFILDALYEDMGTGDVTTNAVVPREAVAVARIIAKEDMVLSGTDVFCAVFLELDPKARFISDWKDGDGVPKGTEIGRLEGLTWAILTGERTALNIFQRMCGIATVTARYVEAVSGTGVRIVDTRKTIPGLRTLDKYAVTCGGGRNHRFGLFDGILIKDNHIRAAGSIVKAVELVRNKVPHLLAVEVETSSMKEVEEALEAKAEVIMLDNMRVEEARTAVKRIGGRAKVEISGGISLKNIREYAVAGPDFISVGALTHSAPAVDISLNLDSFA